jgi:hypothetical protein
MAARLPLPYSGHVISIGLVVVMVAGADGGADELAAIYAADQADRKGGLSFEVVGPRDAERRLRVLQLLDAHALASADDYVHAAMVFQHGMEAADYAKAHDLALKATELEPSNKEARWLAAAAKDRELMKLGKPQLYGTQFRTRADGVWELYTVDPAVTDEERAKWNVPPLSAAQKRLEQLNAKRPAPKARD